MFSKKATKFDKIFTVDLTLCSKCSAIDSESAPPECGGSEKGRSLISAYRTLAITTNTPGFKKLSTALKCQIDGEDFVNFGGLLRKHELYHCEKYQI